MLPQHEIEKWTFRSVSCFKLPHKEMSSFSHTQNVKWQHNEMFCCSALVDRKKKKKRPQPTSSLTVARAQQAATSCCYQPTLTFNTPTHPLTLAYQGSAVGVCVCVCVSLNEIQLPFKYTLWKKTFNLKLNQIPTKRKRKLIFFF